MTFFLTLQKCKVRNSFSWYYCFRQINQKETQEHEKSHKLIALPLVLLTLFTSLSTITLAFPNYTAKAETITVLGDNNSFGGIDPHNPILNTSSAVPDLNITDVQAKQAFVRAWKLYRQGKLNSNSSDVDLRIGQTKAAKAVVKYLIKNKSYIFNAVESIGGKGARRTAEKNIKPILDRLNGLLKREDLLFDTVKKQLEGVLYAVGVPRSVAGAVSVVIVEALKWIA